MTDRRNFLEQKLEFNPISKLGVINRVVEQNPSLKKTELKNYLR